MLCRTDGSMASQAAALRLQEAEAAEAARDAEAAAAAARERLLLAEVRTAEGAQCGGTHLPRRGPTFFLVWQVRNAEGAHVALAAAEAERSRLAADLVQARAQRVMR